MVCSSDTITSSASASLLSCVESFDDEQVDMVDEADEVEEDVEEEEDDDELLRVDWRIRDAFERLFCRLI